MRKFAIVIAIALALLAFDLHFRGLAWQAIWSLTGEEAPLAQIRATVEVAGNLVRHPLDTQPLAAIDHKADIPYGVNTFLQQEVEADKIDAMLGMIRAAGFRWLRQEFPWEDIETDGRGQFTDSRLDRDGDGLRDTIDAWLKYDQIVALAEKHGLRLLVRLSNPPRWSRANPDENDFAPPDDFQDFVNFAVAVAERYRGRVTHYQVWNEPNIYPEWGEKRVDPAGYADMLCRTYAALKAVDADIVVVSGAIAQTIALDGFWGMSDLVYLQALYDHGAGACFDALSAQGYGLRSGPTDQRLRATSVNVARHVYYRDIMVRNGDAHKPIWLSEVAWNATLDADLPPEEIVGYANYGNVTQEQAARYMPQFYERAQQEWTWVGNAMYWFFTRPDPFEAGQAFYYFRMVEPDYHPDKPTFTPLPIYHSVSAYINGQTPTLRRGTHQAESWQISAGEAVEDESARFGRAQLFADGARFRAHGTALHVRWRDAESAEWRVSHVHLSDGLAQSRDVEFGEGAIVVDEIVVFDDSVKRILLWAALGLAIAAVAAGAVVAGARGRAA